MGQSIRNKHGDALELMIKYGRKDPWKKCWLCIYPIDPMNSRGQIFLYMETNEQILLKTSTNSHRDLKFG